MGIFDVFKTKMSEAAEKAGDVAEQAKDRVSDMMDKKKGGAASDPSARAQAPAGVPATGAEVKTEDRASNMVSEGAPVATAGEAAPGVGDDGAPAPGTTGGGMTQSIRDNVAKGTDTAGGTAGGVTGNRFGEEIDSGVQQGKDKLG